MSCIKMLANLSGESANSSLASRMSDSNSSRLVADSVVGMQSCLGDGVFIRVHDGVRRGVPFQPNIRADEPVETKPIVFTPHEVQQIQQSPNDGFGLAVYELKGR